MAQPPPTGPPPASRFAVYKQALQTISVRTGTPLPALLLSAGILHELTAIVPLVSVFYTARTFGVGERVVQALIKDTSEDDLDTTVQRTQMEKGKAWMKKRARNAVEEGDKWAHRVGRRYGMFGYEKLEKGATLDPDEVVGYYGRGQRIAGDVANAVMAYGVTKALMPVRLGVSFYFAPSFARGVLMPIQRTIMRAFGRKSGSSEAMSSSRLRFKDDGRTTAEDEHRRRRKEEKRERKRKRRSKEHATSADEETNRKWASSDQDEDMSSSHRRAKRSHVDGQGTRPQTADEDEAFQEKLYEAMAEDFGDRLDSLEAHFNEFVHIPSRWQSGLREQTGKASLGALDDDVFLKLNPDMLDEEEYAEWVRMGMHRKTHAEEYAERQRQEAARKARKQEAKARRAETARLEREAEERRRRKTAEREQRHLERARAEYNARWSLLLDGKNGGAPLGFGDIPWPVEEAYRGTGIGIGALSTEAVQRFLFCGTEERKERVRETYLRFHPDKFEGRIIGRVLGAERGVVREGIRLVLDAIQ